MKKPPFYVFLTLFFLLFGCEQPVLDTPENFIARFNNVAESGDEKRFLSAGQILQVGDTQVGELYLDLAPYPQGSYFLTILHDTTTGHFKIIKL